MIDNYGRNIEYVRISVTGSCNLNCIYCRPDVTTDCVCPNGDTGMTAKEYGAVASILGTMGIKKVRITGGEPLLRNDLCEIIKNIARVEGIQEIAMTTNAITLANNASKLKSAGLSRVNISLDSLNPDKFEKITGGGDLSKVLEGINTAIEVGLLPVKINVVLIKGVNDDEIDSLINFTKDKPVIVRFIELMPIGKFGEDNRDKIIPSSSIVEARPWLQEVTTYADSSPATYYSIDGGQGLVGFISPMSHRFCNSCNRIRLTCDGKLKPCLGNNYEVDLLDLLRSNSTKLESVIRETIYNKPEGHNFNHKFQSSRDMSKIGG